MLDHAAPVAIIGGNTFAVQGVDYPASTVLFLYIFEGGDPRGAATTAALLNQAASQWPNA